MTKLEELEDALNVAGAYYAVADASYDTAAAAFRAARDAYRTELKKQENTND